MRFFILSPFLWVLLLASSSSAQTAQTAQTAHVQIPIKESPKSNALQMVEAARELLGVPYTFGGRMRGDDGIDCQGVLFYAAERVQKCGWKSFSVMPTHTVRDREFGAPVAGLSPVATSSLSLDKMLPGDIIFFVFPQENPAEKSIGKLGDEEVWVWHTALYAGDGNMISGDFFYGKVVEVKLLPYLYDHAADFAGVYILRPAPKGPSPKKCRRHKPLQRKNSDAS